MKALITTVVQLETEAAAAAEATVHVARFASSTGVGDGAASTTGARRAPSKKCEPEVLSILEFFERRLCRDTNDKPKTCEREGVLLYILGPSAMHLIVL